MKLKILILIAIYLATSGFAKAQNIEAITSDGKKVILRPDKTWDYSPVKMLDISFQNEVITINGSRITLPVERAKLFAILGQPTRTAPLYNTIYTWDEYGIIVYEKPNQTTVFAMAIFFDNAEMEMVFIPKKTFRENITIDGAIITSNTSLEEINRTKKGELFYNSILPYYSELERGNMTVFLEHKKLDNNRKGKVVKITFEFTKT